MPVFEHGQLAALHIDFQQIYGRDFHDIVQPARLDRDLIDDCQMITPTTEQRDDLGVWFQQ